MSGYNKYIQESAPVKAQVGFGDYLSGALQGGAQGAAASGGNPWIALGAGGLSLLNTSNQADAADKAYQNQRAAYEENLGLDRESRLMQKANQNVINTYQGSDFANQTQNDIGSQYARYLQSIGK